MDDTSESGRFIGYPAGTKGYKILLDSGRVIISRDVMFLETGGTSVGLRWCTAQSSKGERWLTKEARSYIREGLRRRRRKGEKTCGDGRSAGYIAEAQHAKHGLDHPWRNHFASMR